MSPLVEMQGTTPAATSEEIDRLRLRYGFWIIITDFALGEELLATIEAQGRDPGGKNVVVCMPRGLLERLGEEPVGALSERETEVLVLVARGLSNLRVATELGISEATIKRHLANVYQKIGVRSRSEAVRMALMEQ